MFTELPEDFDMDEFNKLYVHLISQAFGVPAHYFWDNEQIRAHNDKILEQLWAAFADVPIGERGDNIEEAFMHWPAGTNRFDIWAWFHEKHSKGLNWLQSRKGV